MIEKLPQAQKDNTAFNTDTKAAAAAAASAAQVGKDKGR